MITNESAMDKISVVNRMLAYQREQGESLDSAIAKLKSSLPANFAGSIEAVEKMIKGDEDVAFTGYGAGPFKLFTVLAGAIRKEGGDVSYLFSGANDCFKEAVVQAREFWSGFNSLISYLVIVFFLASSVIGIFTIKVFPQFAETFDSFGADLPAFTLFILQNDSMFILITGILALGTLLCVVASYHIRKQIAKLSPLSSFFRVVPRLRTLDDVYSYFLFIHFAKVLTSAGVKDEAVFSHAKGMAKLTDKKVEKLTLWWDALKSAQVLGGMEKEVQYQASQINALFTRQMILMRESLTLVTQLSLGLLIGLLVIAMYLPIFVLGSTI